MRFTSSLLAATVLSALSAGTARSQNTLTLETTLRRVLAEHPAISAASDRVQAARGSRRTARSWTNPTFTYEVENAALPGRPGIAGVERQVTAMASLPIEPIYQLRSRAARADAELRAAEADLRDERRRLLLSAVSAFYRLASADVAVSSLDDVRRWLDSLVTHTRARVKEGATAEVDLIRLEVEQGSIITDLALARVEQARAAAELAGMVGADSARVELNMNSEIRDAQIALPPRETLVSLARTNRPDLAAAHARSAAAAAGARLEKRSVFREAGVSAGSMRVDGRPAAVAGFSLSVPIFDQNVGEIQRAGAEARAAEHERAALEREVIADVAGAYDAARTLSAQVAAIGLDLLERAEEGRRIAEGAYREGATSVVQVLDAARALSDARQLFYRAALARRQSLIELNAAIGADDLAMLQPVPAVQRGSGQETPR